MLLIKSVTIKWNPANKKHYEEKGYVYTKMGDEFEVKVEDLTEGSNAYVEVKCDGCGKELKNIPWCNYLRYMKTDGKYYCNKCAKVLYTTTNIQKTKLKNSKSFEQWCYDNLSKEEADDILLRWDYELNKCKPNEVSYSSNKKRWFKCLKHSEHKSELKSINHFTHNSKGSMDCKQCNSFAQWGIDNICEDFLEKYWDYEENSKLGINPWEIDKCSNNLKIWIKCQEKDYHGSYKTNSNSFYRGRRCPYCNNFHGKVHFLDSLGTLHPQVFNIWSEKNKKSPFKYTASSTKYVWWKCPDGKHEDYYRTVNSAINSCNLRCPECTRERDESILQEKVRIYLESLGYKTFHENRCTIIPKNPKTKHIMPFDNEIILKNGEHLICEVMGKQHYQITNFHNLQAKQNNTIPKYELHMQQVRDRYKRMYAKSQGYKYLEIPYWTDDKKDTYKKMIDNVIKDVLAFESKVKF